MSPRRELTSASTISDVCAAVESLGQSFDAEKEINAERRRTDDARYRTVIEKHDDVIERVDKHGLRTTALETQWRAFFSDEGAFKHVIAGQEAQGKKLDRLFWAILMLALTGSGVLLKSVLHL